MLLWKLVSHFLRRPLEDVSAMFLWEILLCHKLAYFEKDRSFVNFLGRHCLCLSFCKDDQEKKGRDNEWVLDSTPDLPEALPVSFIPLLFWPWIPILFLIPVVFYDVVVEVVPKGFTFLSSAFLLFLTEDFWQTVGLTKRSTKCKISLKSTREDIEFLKRVSFFIFLCMWNRLCSSDSPSLFHLHLSMHSSRFISLHEYKFYRRTKKREKKRNEVRVHPEENVCIFLKQLQLQRNSVLTQSIYHWDQREERCESEKGRKGFSSSFSFFM